MENRDISAASLQALYARLKCSAGGLSTAEASERAKMQTGLLKPESGLKRTVKLLLRQFNNPFILLLAIAVVLSYVLGESSDAFIVIFILIATGLLGFWQELKANHAFNELNKLVEMKHTVLRDGKPVQLSVASIVGGDILLLDAGDIIPADCRIIESNELHINESTLTGESYPVEKTAEGSAGNLGKNDNCLWNGTNVISGTARALVVYTGKQTLFGQMTHSLMQAPETAFEKGIKRFGFFLLRITVVLSLTILVINLYFKKSLFEAVLFSLAVAVGMAPELLPAIMTFAMSAGARRMMKKKVIVKKLSSVFNFGEVNTLCVDKTGTITEGNIQVKDIVDFQGKSTEQLRRYTWLNASLQNGFTNPVDIAIASMNTVPGKAEKINEIPYDFIRKRLSVAVIEENKKIFITKGAFKNISEICSHIQVQTDGAETISPATRQKMEERFIEYSNKGYRVLGLAFKNLERERVNRDDERNMIFLGYILLEDPLKDSAEASVKMLGQLKIETKIVTGDNRYAAANAARAVGIETPVIITGDEMDQLAPEAFVVKAKHTDIFAEVEPRQKERIIKALQKSGSIVAYLGDGINDVAAINAADVGISTNNATDVAKEAADFVLLEKDLSVLADGVQEGRKSFANSMKYIFITTSATFGNMFSVAGASLMLPFLPMLPKQILLTNLLTDLPFLSIASDHVDGEQLKQPGKWDLKMIRKFMVVFGLHSAVFDFITFYMLYAHLHLTGGAFQTGWFLESAITEIIIVFIIRTKHRFTKSKPGKFLIITAMIALFIIVLLPASPLAGMLGFSALDPYALTLIAGILVTYTITADLIKIAFFKAHAATHSTQSHVHKL